MEAELGKRLQEALSMRHMSQKELAVRTGLTEAAVSRYVKGTREPRAITLSRIAAELNVGLDFFLSSEQSSNPFNETYQLVARNSSAMTQDEKTRLIKMILAEM